MACPSSLGYVGQTEVREGPWAARRYDREGQGTLAHAELARGVRMWMEAGSAAVDFWRDRYLTE